MRFDGRILRYFFVLFCQLVSFALLIVLSAMCYGLREAWCAGGGSGECRRVWSFMLRHHPSTTVVQQSLSLRFISFRILRYIKFSTYGAFEIWYLMVWYRRRFALHPLAPPY